MLTTMTILRIFITSKIVLIEIDTDLNPRVSNTVLIYWVFSLSFSPVPSLASICLIDEDYTPLSMINAIGTTKLSGERPESITDESSGAFHVRKLEATSFQRIVQKIRISVWCETFAWNFIQARGHTHMYVYIHPHFAYPPLSLSLPPIMSPSLFFFNIHHTGRSSFRTLTRE